MARTTVWIPEGKWYDIFTGLRYQGGRKMNLYRDITSIPVLAKAGAIIPFQEDYMESADENPKQLHLYVYTGEDGSFTLYEDDNITTLYRKGKCAKTNYRWKEEEGSLHICSVKGKALLIPEKRDYIITFCGIKDAQIIGKFMSDSRDIEFKVDKKEDISVLLENVSVKEDIVLFLQERVYRDNEVKDRCFRILDHAEIEYSLKEDIFDLIETQTDTASLFSGLLTLVPDHDLCSALLEIIMA